MDMVQGMMAQINEDSQKHWNAKVAKQEAKARAKAEAARRRQLAKEKRREKIEDTLAVGWFLFTFYIVFVFATL